MKVEVGGYAPITEVRPTFTVRIHFTRSEAERLVLNGTQIRSELIEAVRVAFINHGIRG